MVSKKEVLFDRDGEKLVVKKTEGKGSRGKNINRPENVETIVTVYFANEETYQYVNTNYSYFSPDNSVERAIDAIATGFLDYHQEDLPAYLPKVRYATIAYRYTYENGRVKNRMGMWLDSEKVEADLFYIYNSFMNTIHSPVLSLEDLRRSVNRIREEW